MRWQGRALAMAASVAIGVALALGLFAGSSDAPVPFELPAARAALPAADQVDIYAAILVDLTGADAPSRQTVRRPILVSRTLLDTCPKPHSRPHVWRCGRENVGRLVPEVEALIHAALARHGVEALFVDDAGHVPDTQTLVGRKIPIHEVYSVHQIVFDSAGVLAADGDNGYEQGDRFRFTRVDGRWHLKDSTLIWIV
jgi:hypothetical protein